jgi:hypothetical protein
MADTVTVSRRGSGCSNPHDANAKNTYVVELLREGQKSTPTPLRGWIGARLTNPFCQHEVVKQTE